jgi:hypothetical protein
MNIARGSIGYYGDDARGLNGSTDRLHLVILEGTPEADDTLNNYDTLSALLVPAANVEAQSAQYARILLDSTDITFTVDDSGNTAKVVVDADTGWTSVTSSTAWAKLIICWGTSGATTANMKPLTHHDFVVTPNGGDITANFDQTNGIWGSS